MSGASQVIKLLINGDATGALGAIQDVKKESVLLSKNGVVSARAFQRAWASVAKGFVTLSAAISAVSFAALYEGGKAAGTLESNMRNVNTITRLSESEFSKLYKKVQALPSAFDLGQGPAALSDALYDISSAGFKGADGVDVLVASSRLATGGLTEIKLAGDGLTSVLNAYGLEASEAGRISDVFFKTVELGKTTVGDLAGNIGQAVPLLSKAGVSFEEFGSAIATLTTQGVKTEDATTQIKNTVQALLKPSEGAKQAFNEMGISFGENALKSKGFVGILKEIQEKTGGSAEAIAKLLPNVRGLQGVLGLLNNSGEDYAEALAQIENAAGSTQSAVDEQSKSLFTTWSKLTANIETLASRFGDAILPIATSTVTLFNDMAKAVNSLPEGFFTAATGLATFAGVFGGAVVTVGTGLAVFSSLQGTLLAMTSTTALLGTGGAFAVLATMFTNAAAAALPFVAQFAAVIGVIGLAATAAYGLYKAFTTNFGGIKTTVTKAWSTVKNSFTDAYNHIAASITKISSKFPVISDTLAGSLDTAGGALDTFLDVSTAFAETFIIVVGRGFEVMADIITNYVDAAVDIWEIGVDKFLNITGIWGDNTLGLWDKIWGTVRELLEGTWNAILEIIGVNLDNAGSILGGGYGIIYDASWGSFRGLLDAVSEVLKSAARQIISFLGQMETALAGFGLDVGLGSSQLADMYKTIASFEQVPLFSGGSGGGSGKSKSKKKASGSGGGSSYSPSFAGGGSGGGSGGGGGRGGSAASDREAERAAKEKAKKEREVLKVLKAQSEELWKKQFPALVEQYELEKKLSEAREKLASNNATTEQKSAFANIEKQARALFSKESQEAQEKLSQEKLEQARADAEQSLETERQALERRVEMGQESADKIRDFWAKASESQDVSQPFRDFAELELFRFDQNEAFSGFDGFATSIQEGLNFGDLTYSDAISALEAYSEQVKGFPDVYRATQEEIQTIEQQRAEFQRQFLFNTKDAILGGATAMTDSFGQLFSGVLSGSQSLAEGWKSAFEGMKQYALSVISEIASKLLTSSIFKLFGSIFGGGLGSIFSEIGTSFNPFKKAHTGGLAGGNLRQFKGSSLRSDEIATILKKGERVIPNRVANSSQVNNTTNNTSNIYLEGSSYRDRSYIDDLQSYFSGKANYQFAL